MAIAIRNERMIRGIITCHPRIIEASARIETGLRAQSKEEPAQVVSFAVASFGNHNLTPDVRVLCADARLRLICYQASEAKPKAP